MNILFLAEGDPETPDSWSGIPVNVIERFRSKGHSVTTADVDLAGRQRMAAAAASFHPNRTHWRARYRLGSVGFRMRSSNAADAVRRSEGIDLILQPGATFLPPQSKVPVAIYCDSNILIAERHRDTGVTYANRLTPAQRERLAEREAHVYSRASVIFTMSERLRQSFIEDFRLPADKVVTVYGGANMDLSRVRPGKDRESRTILYVGRDFERKGGPVLLEAFARLQREFADAELIIIGPDRPTTVPPGVTWLGFLNRQVPEHKAELERSYQRAGVFCLPTRFEPFGVSYLEAMVWGLPCVGTDMMAVPEIIDEGETGFVVAPDSASELADRLRTLLLDPDRARRMGTAGRARALDRFTWDATVDRMLAALSDPVARRGA